MGIPDSKIWVCNGTKFILFERRDIISDSLKVNGVFEEDLLKLSALLCSEISNPLILDIGANLGSYAIPMGQILKKCNGEVYAYEPQRIPFYQLCANVVLNQLDNVFPHNIALGHEDSYVQIYEADLSMWNSGAYSLIEEYREAEGISSHLAPTFVETKISTLDGMRFPKSISLIKIDVEGFEIHVIEGGENFLKANDYPPIIFEAWDAPWFLDKKNALFEKIFKLNYEIDQINSTNYLAQHKNAHRKIQFSNLGGVRRASLISR